MLKKNKMEGETKKNYFQFPQSNFSFPKKSWDTFKGKWIQNNSFGKVVIDKLVWFHSHSQELSEHCLKIKLDVKDISYKGITSILSSELYGLN